MEYSFLLLRIYYLLTSYYEIVLIKNLRFSFLRQPLFNITFNAGTGSGLKLFKGDKNFENWQPVKVDENGKITNNPCK